MKLTAGLPIRRKVALAFAVILLVAMGPSIAALWGLSAVHQAAAEVRTSWLPATRLLGEIGRAYARLRIADARVVSSADPAVLARGRQIAAGNLDMLQRSLRSYELLSLPIAEHGSVAARAATMARYTESRDRVSRLATAADRTAARQMWFGETNLLFRPYNEILDVSIARMTKLADGATDRGERVYRASLWLLLAGAVAAVATASGTGLALAGVPDRLADHPHDGTGAPPGRRGHGHRPLRHGPHRRDRRDGTRPRHLQA
jgi:hypothetical protein